jgi:hypothetical protein
MSNKTKITLYTLVLLPMILLYSVVNNMTIGNTDTANLGNTPNSSDLVYQD